MMMSSKSARSLATKIEAIPKDNVEGNMEAVALHILSAGKEAQKQITSGGDSADHEPIISCTNSIAHELNNLAGKAGSPDFASGGKKIASQVAILNDEVKVLAEKIGASKVGLAGANKRLKDNLLSQLEALSNHTVQLGILASVKASASAESRDGDDKLVSVTRLLGYVMSDMLEGVAEAKLKLNEDGKRRSVRL